MIFMNILVNTGGRDVSLANGLSHYAVKLLASCSSIPNVLQIFFIFSSKISAIVTTSSYLSSLSGKNDDLEQ